MYLFDFKHKLRRLDARLYVDDTRGGNVTDEWKSCAILARVSGSSRVQGRTVEERAALESDPILSGVPANWVPEHDLYCLTADPKTGDKRATLVAKGWRNIVLYLVKQGYGSIERARRLFSSSLGEYTYDKMTPAERRDLSLKEASQNA